MFGWVRLGYIRSGQVNEIMSPNLILTLIPTLTITLTSTLILTVL